MLCTLKTLSVRKLTRAASLIAATSLMCAPLALAGEVVEMDKTHMLKLPRPAASVILGNPDIADVSVHSDQLLFLIGRSYGETDLIILDSAGNTMMQTDITVIAAQNRREVSLIKIGDGRETYHCAPDCRPSPKFGDSTNFIGNFGPNSGTINNGVAALSNPEPQVQGGPPSEFYEGEGEFRE